jgi:hypothetical protein
VRLVVTHLTRMEPGFICVAGQDAGTLASVRPVIPGQRLGRAWLQSEGGPLALSALVELVDPRPCGAPPKVEDCAFRDVRRVGALDATASWAMLSRCAQPRLRDVFGPLMASQGSTAAMPEGQGAASLGIIRPSAKPTLSVWPDAIKLNLADAGRHYSVAVTDLRLVGPDHKTPDPQMVQRLERRLAMEECILSVGVGTAWQKPGDDRPRHWLQINNIHFPSTVDWSV